MVSLTLDKLAPGEAGRIIRVAGNGALRRRLTDMGLTGGARIEMVRVSPLGDPAEYRLRGYHLSLRNSEAELIEVDLSSPAQALPESLAGPEAPQPLVMCRSGRQAVVSRTRGGKRVSAKLKALGLVPGATIMVVRNQMPGPLIIAVDQDARLILGRGLALHILVQAC